jgi:hypothetical protein
MAKEIEASTYNIISIKGDVWLHQNQTTQLISGNGNTISLGDALSTAPLAQATIELTSTHHIQIGSIHKEALVIDHAVQDQIHDINEVAIDDSSLVSVTMASIVDAISQDINLNQGSLGFLTGHEDSALSYQPVSQHESHPTPTVELRDVISDFNPASDRFMFPHSGSIAAGSMVFTEAQNKVSTNQIDIALHKIDDHGYVSFKDSQGRDIPLTETGLLNPIVDYLAQNFSGRVGDTVMFKVAQDSYIFHYHPEVYTQHFSLIKFEGLAFDGMTHSHDGLFGNYLYVDFS